MMKIKRKLATPVSLIAAGLLALSVFSMSDAKPLQAAQTAGGYNGSILRISSNEARKGPKFIKIGLGKSLVLELPTGVRDVLISNPKLMDAVVHTSNRVYLIGLKVGQANAFFFDRDGGQILTLEVTVEQDMEPVKRLLSRLIPGSNIKLESVNNNVIMTGSVRTPAQSNRASDIVGRFIAKGGSEKEGSKRVVNMLAVEAREQVMLKVRVVEMNRRLLKQFGINWQAAISNVGNTTINAVSDPTFGLGSAIFDQGVNATVNSANTYLSSTLRAMERTGMVKTLAEPNLTSISGDTASFHAGGEFPFLTGLDPDTHIATYDWKKYGVLVNFTPNVLSEGRISLKVDAEVSEITTEGAANIPAVAIRKTETTIELPSGGSMVIGGLISQKTRQSVDGIPGIKDMPVLGSLFRSRDFIKEETELVILVTPYMVKPVSANKLVTPDAGFAEASDAKINLLNHFNRVYGRRGKLPKGRQHGDYGFIVE